MSTDPTATVNAYFEAFGARDIDRILSFFTTDTTWIVPGDKAVTPWVGRRTGPEDIGQFFTLFFQAAEPRAFEVFGMTQVSADQVLVAGRFAYHFPGSGHDIDDEFVMRYTVDGGKITGFRIFEDSLGLARAYTGEPVA